MSAEQQFVKVYNLTDVETPTLVKHRMSNVHIAVGARMCNPGEFVELVDTPVLRGDVKFLVSIGALSLGQPPPPYVQARTAKLAEGGALSVHIQHLDVAETKVATDPLPAPPVPDVSYAAVTVDEAPPAPAPEATNAEPAPEALPLEAPAAVPSAKPAQSNKNSRK